MTMIPLDESLDVGKRLADLRMWQTEWQRLDRQLEEQLILLDGNNLLELQQSVHIANLRRRMEMTLVKQPLSIPESVLKHLGVRAIRDQFALQFARLIREERLLWLNSFLFFMTADLRKLDEKIAKVRNYRSLGQTRNFLLGGESGMGKTTYLDWLMFNHLPVVEKERNRVPIIGIQAPVSQNTARPLLWRMLLECGQTYVKSDNEEILLMKLVLYFQKCGVELIVIDEVQHIQRPELKRRVLEVSNMTRGIPMICAATHPITWTEGDAEIKGRWNDVFQLRQYTGTRLEDLLATIELFLPFSQDSHLSMRTSGGNSGPAALIEQWTGGILRDIMILIGDGCRRAIEGGHASLKPETLAASWKDIQTKQVTDFLDLIRQREMREARVMETEQRVDRERAIWKVLPLHPQPQPLESFTSYLIRLAEANGLQSIRELVALVGSPQRRRESLYNSPDYPAPSFYAGLAQITGCPEERLLPTTFHFLIRRFGRSTYPHALHQFLRKSLASSLRYCPACLAECDPPSYSLLWRFLVLPGCTEHGVRLLDQCAHCGSLLPLLTSPPQLARCPTCQGDLRTCQQTRLSDEILQPTHRHTQDLKMLLSPMPRPLEEAQAKTIGKQCMAFRQRQGFLITEVANLSGQELSVIMDIEQGSSLKKASLNDYMRYADALSCSLLEVFDTDRHQELLVPLSEEQTLKQVEAAIQQLKRQSGPITARTIRNLVGISTSRLRCYPQVDSLLTECLKGQARQGVLMKNQREEELVKLVEQAIEYLRARGSRVSQQRIADLLGMTRSALMVYPRVKAQLRQIAYNGPPHDLLRKVQDAIEQAQALGTSLTHRSISEQIGISLGTLRGDPQARAIIQRAQNESRQQRENALVNRVEHAIAQLLLRGEKPSLPKVSQIVGRNYASLYHRPQIRELFLFLR